MAFEFLPTLSGESVRLRPLEATDLEAVFAAASDPLVWEQHPAHDRWKRGKFEPYFENRLGSGGTLVIIDKATDQIIGWSTYAGYNEADSEVEIGWTFLARSYWGGATNWDVKRTMLTHAFKFVDTVLFVIGENNMRSQKGTGKIGARMTDRRTEMMINDVAVPHVIMALSKVDFEARVAAKSAPTDR